MIRSAPHSVLALVVLASSCYRTTIRSGARTVGEEHGETEVSALWGLTSIERAAGECPAGLSSVTVYFPWWSGFVRLITIGLIDPVSYEYRCAGIVDRAVAASDLQQGLEALGMVSSHPDHARVFQGTSWGMT
jgi:hypothetical protein